MNVIITSATTSEFLARHDANDTYDFAVGNVWDADEGSVHDLTTYHLAGEAHGKPCVDASAVGMEELQARSLEAAMNCEGVERATPRGVDPRKHLKKSKELLSSCTYDFRLNVLVSVAEVEGTQVASIDAPSGRIECVKCQGTGVFTYTLGKRTGEVARCLGCLGKGWMTKERLQVHLEKENEKAIRTKRLLGVNF